MVMAPQLYTATVMHKRIFPKENAFHYGVYYLALPLPLSPVSVTRGRFTRFDPKDVGKRDGSDPTAWARDILHQYGLNDTIQNIVLITMPRVLGYVFNPISFYLCFDEDKAVRAVLCEVHNTFGEQHCYLCAHPDRAPIESDAWLEAEKVFHVSPFLERHGTYKFRFDIQEESFGVWIDYYDAHRQRQLITSLKGDFSPLTVDALNRAFWQHPWVTMKAILLIHWQAVRLIAKGIKHLAKPEQRHERVTATENLRKREG